MKIDERTQTPAAGLSRSADTASARALSGLKSGGSGAAGGSDTVELSGPSRVLQASASDRASRIGSLTESVRNGSYNVSSAKISQALVQETVAQQPR